MSGGAYYGGGTYTGNSWLKFVTFSAEPTQEIAKYVYIMMEPTPLPVSLMELEKRGIPYKIYPQIDETLWAVNVQLQYFDVPSTNFSICEYYPGTFKMTTTPKALHIEEHRELLRARRYTRN